MKGTGSSPFTIAAADVPVISPAEAMSIMPGAGSAQAKAAASVSGDTTLKSRRTTTLASIARPVLGPKAPVIQGGAAPRDTQTAQVAIYNSTISNNTAGNTGGGISTYLPLHVEGSTLTGNTSSGAQGGAVMMMADYTAGPITALITGTVISNNSANLSGGGVANFGGSLTVQNSTFSNNVSVTDDGGGIYTYVDMELQVFNSTFSGNTAATGGGGVFVSAGTTASINGSTFTQNSAGGDGGGFNSFGATSSVINSTFSDNTATGKGGGILGHNTPLTIRATTIVSNGAANGGGLAVNYAPTTISHSILAGNTATSEFHEFWSNSSDTTVTSDHNVLGSSATTLGEGFRYFTPGTGDRNAMFGYDDQAELGEIINTTLADNGGSTLTHDLVAGSPALDISTAPCDPAVDQRGIARPQGTSCDAGAVEHVPITGTIHIVKVTTPAGLLNVFDFSSDIAGSETFTLTDGMTETFTTPIGTYTVTEVAETGFTLDDIDCTTGGTDDGTTATIVLTEDAEVTCTFTNVADTGTVVINKVTEPAGLATSFNFTSTSTLSPTFSLSDGESISLTLPVGSFSFAEEASPGISTDIDCITPARNGGGSSGTKYTGEIGSKGDIIRCTVTNTVDTGTLLVTKVVTPTGLTDSFSFTVTNGTSLTETFSLSGGMTETFTLPVGSYVVTEAVTDGFELLDVDCGIDVRVGRVGVSNEAPVTIVKGETETCTFTNGVIEDVDGVDPTTESGAPNGGDGNGDGIPDYLQNNVTSLPNGEDQAYVSIAAPAGTQMTAVSTGPAPATLPDGVKLMPIGVISFTLTSLTPGATVTVTLHLQDGITADTYFKLQSGVWTAYPNAEFVDSKTIVLTLTDGGAGDLDGTANGIIVDPGAPGTAASDAGVFISTWTAGSVDGLNYGPHDVLGYDSEAGEWTKWFDGAAAGLSPVGKWKHNLNAIWISDTEDSNVIFSLTQDNRTIPGVPGVVDGMDLLAWDGTALSLWFDGQDVGLNVKTQEKIDGLHVLAEAPDWSEFSGDSCQAYLLLSTQGVGIVPKPGNKGNVLKFSGEDILGFCATNLGTTTTGFWELVVDGSAQGVKRNTIDSLAANDDASVLYVMSKGAFRVDDAFGGHSMVFAFDMGTESFSGPYVRVMDDLGIQPKVDALHVSGELGN